MELEVRSRNAEEILDDKRVHWRGELDGFLEDFETLPSVRRLLAEAVSSLMVFFGKMVIETAEESALKCMRSNHGVNDQS